MLTLQLLLDVLVDLRHLPLVQAVSPLTTPEGFWVLSEGGELLEGLLGTAVDSFSTSTSLSSSAASPNQR